MITIPHRLKQILERDQFLCGETNATVGAFTPWFHDNKLIFFPEYTDHGTNHLQEVLNTASSIITDESWNLLSPQDAAAIIISILLHDCAMHISEDGFYSLIDNKYPCLNSRYVSQEISWREKWLSYLAEARRWDGKKLKLIFGDMTPIREIPLDKNDLTRRDRLLIGEFLRREHANLAHSIALIGVPPLKDNPLKLHLSDKKLCDLIGFIAKSHNLSLRTATDKLGTAQKRSAYNVHAPYIMGVLRISDYIQVHSSRAEKQLLSVKSLTSPISNGEWEKHNSILDINQTHEDPEAIYIDAEPQSPIIFKALKNLFSDIQKELDSTWSVIGEVYGRFQSLERLGINIRRIRSSLDDEKLYLRDKKPSFIPRPLNFRTSDAEMISLLVAPLYGNKPSIGIREIVQNAVDACNERIDFHEKSGQHNFNINDIDVTVRVDVFNEKEGKVSITDNGIGMNLNIIENFFLNIGASFRNSDIWKEMHETDGHSNVHRTGRFGVGLLAAFLLGDEILVETRHVSEPKGLKFSCSKDSEDISIIPFECPIGTKITINLSEFALSELRNKAEQQTWDWYCLSSPKVNRLIQIEGTEHVLDQKMKVPSSGDDISDLQWYRIEHVDFDDILWRPVHNERLRQIICNGITLSQRGIYFRLKKNDSPVDIEIISPDLVIYDQDGKMPINLTRDGLTSEKLPFNEELVLDISSKLAQEVYENFYTKPSILNATLVEKFHNNNLKFTDKSIYRLESVADLFYFNGKVYPSNHVIIYNLKPDAIFIDATSSFDNINSINVFNSFNSAFVYVPFNLSRRSRSSKTQFVRSFFDRNMYTNSIPCCGKRLFIKLTEVDEILKPGSLPKSVWAKLSLEWKNEKWCIMKVGNVPALTIDPDDIFVKMDSDNQTMFACLYSNWELDHQKPSHSIFAEAWKAIT
ncbi:HD domain-containing protein [Enterobacter hormaechei]|jgi:molecular chaperone HtpG